MTQETETRRFLVTTPGLCATRWLSFVLASRPDVYVAHGKHSLESITRGRFDGERQLSDKASLVFGNVMSDFYRCRSLTDIFEIYRDFMPGAAVLGNVHSYTLNEIVHRFGTGANLKGIRIANVLRHPVAYIASHVAMVRSSVAHRPLHEHYRRMFGEALKRWPELLDVPCQGGEDVEAFIVSCFSASLFLDDFQHDLAPHVRMEDLTADVNFLQKFCENLTQLSYDRGQLAEFIREGPINRHRNTRRPRLPHEIYAEWTGWKRHVAALLLSEELIDRFADARYDVSMLRGTHQDVRAIDRSAAANGSSTLADFVDPTLKQAVCDKTLVGPPILVESGYRSFNIVQFRGEYLGLAQSLGPVDLMHVDDAWLDAARDAGTIVVGESLVEIRERVDQLMNAKAAAANAHGTLADFVDPALKQAVCDKTLVGPPILVESGYRSFNIVQFLGQYLGLSQSLGPVDLMQVDDAWLYAARDAGKVVVGDSLVEVRERVAELIDTAELIDAKVARAC